MQNFKMVKPPEAPAARDIPAAAWFRVCFRPVGEAQEDGGGETFRAEPAKRMRGRSGASWAASSRIQIRAYAKLPIVRGAKFQLDRRQRHLVSDGFSDFLVFFFLKKQKSHSSFP